MRARSISFPALVLAGLAVLGSGQVFAAPLGTREARPARAVEARTVVPGPAPVFSWPAMGEAALAVAGVGMLGRSPDQRVVPIASVTKMMTALLVLKAHPLKPGEAGPSIVIDGAEETDYLDERAEGDSVLPVRAGEVLDEYQLLEGLLIPSGDNIADLLAAWTAGSLPAFVGEMNAAAAGLGLRETHYADASGLNPGSQSSAGDQAIVAATLMQSAVVRSIVRRRAVFLPVAGIVHNYNPALGVAGIIGVKSGYTGVARSCLVTAAWRTVRGQSVLVVAVVFGQTGGLARAARLDESLLGAASAHLVRYRPVRAGEIVSTTPVPGGTLPVELEAATSIDVVGWPGLVLRRRVTSSAPAGTAAVAGVAGSVEVAAPWGSVGSAPLEAVVTPP